MKVFHPYLFSLYRENYLFKMKLTNKIFRHYNGKLYQVLRLYRDSSNNGTGHWHVLYRSVERNMVTKKFDVWGRPLKEFREIVPQASGPRFREVS